MSAGDRIVNRDGPALAPLATGGIGDLDIVEHVVLLAFSSSVEIAAGLKLEAIGASGGGEPESGRPAGYSCS
jgi:hypothetical protein